MRKIPQSRLRHANVFDQHFPGQRRIECQRRLERQFGAALVTRFEPHEAALQRMHFLDGQRLREPENDLRQRNMLMP